MKRALLLGCGNDHRRKLLMGDEDERFSDCGSVEKIDINPDCGATVVYDLDKLHHGYRLSFEDEWFDEIHSYDVMEHYGRQGDFVGFFREFREYWRVLKPGGTFRLIIPIGEDRYADPGHCRFLHGCMFNFLRQDHYDRCRQEGSQTTDYRWLWKHNFEAIHAETIGGSGSEHHFAAILKKS